LIIENKPILLRSSSRKKQIIEKIHHFEIPQKAAAFQMAQKISCFVIKRYSSTIVVTYSGKKFGLSINTKFSRWLVRR